MKGGIANSTPTSDSAGGSLPVLKEGFDALHTVCTT